MRGRTSYSSLTAAALVLAVATPLAAQQTSRPVYGIGYVTNAPDLLAGGAAYVVLPVLGGLGLYVDAKFDTSDRRDDEAFDPTLTARQVDDEIGDAFRADESSWRSVNAAIIRPITPALMLYAGVGYARETVYREYFDDTRERGLAGVYWVEAPDDNATTVNAMAGMLVRLTPWFNAHFGMETAPRGATVGISITYPPTR
jgi:hypothetical protein